MEGVRVEVKDSLPFNVLHPVQLLAVFHVAATLLAYLVGDKNVPG